MACIAHDPACIPMISIEGLITSITLWLQLIAELISVIVIMVGIVITIFKLVRGVRLPDVKNYNEARLTFSRHLVLALDFLLASDILVTAVAPSWDQLGRLAVIAIIRTFLNFFIQLEMREERRELGFNTGRER